MQPAITKGADEAGFTLVELLVVIIIIGILAAVAVPTFLSQRAAGYAATLQSDLRNVAVEAEGYFHINSTYDGLENDAAFTGFLHSPNVVMTLADVDSTSSRYCIQAVLMSETWSVRTDAVSGQASISVGGC